MIVLNIPLGEIPRIGPFGPELECRLRLAIAQEAELARARGETSVVLLIAGTRRGKATRL